MPEEQPQPPHFIPPVPPSASFKMPAPGGQYPPGTTGKDAQPFPVAPGTPAAVDFLHHQLQSMERELLWERERTQAAENRLKQQDALRAEADKQLKEILEQLRQEKAERDRNEEKSHDQGRIDALESRLDEMHKTWAELLKEAIAQRDSANSRAPERSIAPSIGAEGAAQASQTLEQVRDLIARWNTTIEDRIGGLLRERNALQETLEGSRHQIRQEYLKERAAMQSQFNQEIQDIRHSLGQIQKTFQGTSTEASQLQEMISKLHELLNRPTSAKDQIVAELEREKQDLMRALKDRTDQLRNYTLERRETERSMGEAMMNLNRELEAERAKHQNTSSETGDLQLQIQSLRAELEQAKKSADDRDKRWATLAQERDQLLQAFMAEAQKVQGQIASRMESDKAWEERFNQLQTLLTDEKNKNLEASTQLAALRTQIQTLTEHMTKTLQDKDKTETQSLTWKKEKDELLATLRQKEEIIAMLSATFQNMMKK